MHFVIGFLLHDLVQMSFLTLSFLKTFIGFSKAMHNHKLVCKFLHALKHFTY